MSDELSNEIANAVEEYRRVWPEPYALAPNLELAVRANAARAAENQELAEARETLMRLRSWAVNAAFEGEPGADSVLVILNRAEHRELLPVSQEPYHERGGRIPTQEERDEVRELLAKKKQDTPEELKTESSQNTVLAEIRAAVERYWTEFEEADKWIDPDGRRAQVFARLGNTLDRILEEAEITPHAIIEVTDAMVTAALEAHKNPKRMLTNTSDGNAWDRMEAALEAALKEIS